MKSTNKYFNPNPLKKETGDCVVRALCKALDKDWNTVYDLLCAKGKETSTMPNSKESYESVLIENGFERVKVTVKKGSKRPTVDFIAKKTKNKSICVCSVSNHLVTTKDGFSWDIWDSGYKPIYTYYEKSL